MRVGTILWYDQSKGYGFIEDGNGKSFLFHAKDFDSSCVGLMTSGRIVDFEMCVTGWTAVSVRPWADGETNGGVHSQS